ncbi:uncharacterized protein CMU_030000 [Cryptosporidium muris RN66]|uniref:Uncharacterized protein n=1 Tax=Cryptosporidium muris (strain RN66) TaxID=441375 RepID=B6AI83_CRYMR|nr:uncharacterized protein CMU_030000 [Cryptosporidium muris RN66]EEA07924.1 hypothetical protein, conserved [Cryptosporidium muris RN66]|eukprot:XP_002142273.1 hypothetical protein [Cryptosporidium muris RN66]
MEVTVTRRLKNFLTDIDSAYKDLETIDIDILYKIYTETSFNIDPNKNDILSLQELLLDSKKSLIKSDRVIENFSLMEILRRRSEERRYQKSISNIPQYKNSINIVPDIFGKSYSKDVIWSINALIGLILTFLGGFFAPLFFGIIDITTRTFVGFGCSILCLIAEIALFMLYDIKRNQKIAKNKQNDPILKFLRCKSDKKLLSTKLKANGIHSIPKQKVEKED